MEFGFSVVGLIFLIMLFVPNIIWARNKPDGYDMHVKNENRTLLIFERVGQVLVVCFSLIFVVRIDFSLNLSILVLAFLLMVLYEIYWFRYFKSSRTMADMYASFLKIPVAGATLPVLAFLFLGIYENNVFLIISAMILGIGHIPIHLAHERESG